MADRNDIDNTHVKNNMYFYRSFTERAIRIISFTYDADRRRMEDFNSNISINGNDNDRHIRHANRLLLNHGYLENASKTQNKEFLENNTVKHALNEMWFGSDELCFKRVYVH